MRILYKFFIVGMFFLFIPFVQADTESRPYTDVSQLTPEQKVFYDRLNSVQQENLLHPPKPVYPIGTIDCQDYLTFGKISIDISPSEHSLLPGTLATFSGKVINPFNYPVVEGQVYAKIFYKNSKSVENEHLNGHRLVAQFIAVDNIALKANEKKPVTFTWQVPASAQAGDYEVVFYYSSAHRHSITGLTFTNDITGNVAAFQIDNTYTDLPVYFDEDTVKLNDKNFYFAQPIPAFAKEEKVIASFALVNPKDTPNQVEVTYKLYSWDALFAGNFKTEKTEKITLQPQETKSLSYEVPVIDNSVSYVVVTVKDHDAESILDIRFSRNGIEETHNNKLGVATYPLKAGATSTLFACAHSAGPNNVKDSVITVTLKDADQNILHTFTYANGITSSVLGFKDDFVLEKDLYDFTLTSSVTQVGKPAQEITIRYSCSAIDPTLCPKSNTSLIIFGSAVVILIVALGTFLIVRRKRGRENNMISTNEIK
ncbi:MAG: hypothetical protein PHH40_01815 [Candidatus Moranbacteria bacterium]|nr:hypothetical protein [Candidatus Moranbacteria bacterium]MDD3965043.1 hypothetical protein [Candidatus Moranbacteria bacterium]